MTKDRFIQLLWEAITDFAPAISCADGSWADIHGFHRYQNRFQDIGALYLP